MKSLSLFSALNIILSLIFLPFTPWWMALVITGLLAFILRIQPGQAFLAGYLAIYAIWTGFAYFYNFQNGGILATQVSTLFENIGTPWLIQITGIIGGLAGGLGALAGSLTRRIFTWQLSAKS